MGMRVWTDRTFVGSRFITIYSQKSDKGRHYHDDRSRRIVFNKIITGHETCCFACDPETKRQISEWVGETSPRPMKLKFQRSRIKAILTNFFDSQGGLVHKEFVPEGKTVKAEFYKGVTSVLVNRIQRVRPAAFCCRNIFLLKDNAAPPPQ